MRGAIAAAVVAAVLVAHGDRKAAVLKDESGNYNGRPSRRRRGGRRSQGIGAPDVSHRVRPGSQ
jgi:hypothetical protein